MIHPVKSFVLFLLLVYKYCISPHIRPCCRFYPTCSSYAYQAVQKHGPFRGMYLAARRLLRCHPFHQGGYDPVP